jgi:(1->4)-alpha-D-glucan 1-alpha-D-glucosylmutase
VARWSRLNGAARTNVDGEPAPDRGDVYLFYLALLGAWPATGATLPPPADLVERLQGYMLKALREAKLHTSWVNNNLPYEQATERFVAQVLGRESGEAFLSSFAPFCAQIAFQGMLNSLAQVVLKLACPGVPDIYQGSETWNLSLADPDNRRPVDFTALSRELSRMEAYLDERSTPAKRGAFVGGLLRAWQDGRIKQLVTAAGLRLRRRLGPVFLEGEYLPLEVEGVHSDHVVALARRLDDRLVVAVVPRLCGGLGAASLRLPIGARVWRDTRLRLPAGAGKLVDAFTGASVEARGEGDERTLALAEVLAELPVALLFAGGDAGSSGQPVAKVSTFGRVLARLRRRPSGSRA